MRHSGLRLSISRDWIISTSTDSRDKMPVAIFAKSTTIRSASTDGSFRWTTTAFRSARKSPERRVELWAITDRAWGWIWTERKMIRQRSCKKTLSGSHPFRVDSDFCSHHRSSSASTSISLNSSALFSPGNAMTCWKKNTDTRLETRNEPPV